MKTLRNRNLNHKVLKMKNSQIKSQSGLGFGPSAQQRHHNQKSQNHLMKKDTLKSILQKNKSHKCIFSIIYT